MTALRCTNPQEFVMRWTWIVTGSVCTTKYIVQLLECVAYRIEQVLLSEARILTRGSILRSPKLYMSPCRICTGVGLKASRAFTILRYFSAKNHRHRQWNLFQWKIPFSRTHNRSTFLFFCGMPYACQPLQNKLVKNETVNRKQ